MECGEQLRLAKDAILWAFLEEYSSKQKAELMNYASRPCIEPYKLRGLNKGMKEYVCSTCGRDKWRCL